MGIKYLEDAKKEKYLFKVVNKVLDYFEIEAKESDKAELIMGELVNIKKE
ncbi:MAG: hypothetical protein AABY22_02990 [Nanoarchaeota archaeon]